MAAGKRAKRKRVKKATTRRRAAVAGNSDAFWDCFEACVREQCPDKVALLPTGASKQMIELVEAVLEIKLPLPVKKFYQRHDGSGDFCFGPWIIGGGSHRFLPLKELARLWKDMCKLAKEFERDEDDEFDFGEQEGPIKKHYWHRKWFPITNNGQGDNILLDLDPPPGGSRGQMVDWWHEGGKSTWVAGSFVEWLDGIAKAIAQGKMRVVSW